MFEDVNCEKTRIEQHRDGEMHRSRMSNLNIPISTSTTTMYNTKTLIFVGFLQANIALHKLRNPSIKMFEKLGVKIPSESACRKVVIDLHEQN